MNHELNLYRGEPVGILEITKEMEVPTKGLRVDPTKNDQKTVYELGGRPVTVKVPTELTVRFQTDQPLDSSTRYWVREPNRSIQFDLPPPRKEGGLFSYTVVVPLRD